MGDDLLWGGCEGKRIVLEEEMGHREPQEEGCSFMETENGALGCVDLRPLPRMLLIPWSKDSEAVAPVFVRLPCAPSPHLSLQGQLAQGFLSLRLRIMCDCLQCLRLSPQSPYHPAHIHTSLASPWLPLAPIAS